MKKFDRRKMAEGGSSGRPEGSAAPVCGAPACGERPVIDVRDLVHRYHQGTSSEVLSLERVSLRVKHNTIVGIMGPNGSGKSTLLQHLNGLIRPQEGEVFVDGVPLSDPSAPVAEIRQKIGLVFQNPEDQLFERFAGDDVAFGPRNSGLSRDEVRERVRRAMEMVGLPFSMKDRLTVELSRGEKRRLALAGVLANEPQVLVLDEPMANLDPAGRRKFVEILRKWRAADARSIIFVSHNTEDMAELAQYVYVLFKGRVVLQGTPAEVFSNRDKLLEFGIPIPFAFELIYELKRRGYPVHISHGNLTLKKAVKRVRKLIDA